MFGIDIFWFIQAKLTKISYIGTLFIVLSIQDSYIGTLFIVLSIQDSYIGTLFIVLSIQDSILYCVHFRQVSQYNFYFCV